MAPSGGANLGGLVFRVNGDGTGFAPIYPFTAGSVDGGSPQSSLVQSGSLLLGMTNGGGINGNGVIFNVDANSGAYNVMYRFTGGTVDGSSPLGSLVQSGSTFYGMTYAGGSAGGGVVFRINADNTGYTILHHFGTAAVDGFHPAGSLTVSGNTLYGTTLSGGTAGGGTVFKISTDGTGFGVLHSFDPNAGDGSSPAGSLTLSESVLYGTTNVGAAGVGAAFRVNTDGSGYQMLHVFTGGSGGTTDGSRPDGDLTLVDGRLFGLTAGGGTNALGTLFQMQTDGTDYNVDYNFTGGPSDGSSPNGSLLLGDDGILRGMTLTGGANNLGTIFEFTPIPEPSTLLLTGAAGLTAYLVRRYRRRSKPC
jgi:uncharacterized repeat protein (TIGR03803 family)